MLTPEELSMTAQLLANKRLEERLPAILSTARGQINSLKTSTGEIPPIALATTLATLLLTESVKINAQVTADLLQAFHAPVSPGDLE